MIFARIYIPCFLKFFQIEISDRSEGVLSSRWASGSKYPDDWGMMFHWSVQEWHSAHIVVINNNNYEEQIILVIHYIGRCSICHGRYKTSIRPYRIHVVRLQTCGHHHQQGGIIVFTNSPPPSLKLSTMLIIHYWYLLFRYLQKTCKKSSTFTLDPI